MLGNGCTLALALIAVFLLCGVVYIVTPILVGFFFPFYAAGTVAAQCCCGYPVRKCPCWARTIVVFFSIIAFFVILAILEVICLTLGAVGAVAGAIMTVPTMLYTLYFGLRLLCIRCKRLK